jgi:hypothetical protein
MRKDWVPQNHEAFYDKAAQTMTYLTPSNISRMGLAGIQPWITETLLPAYAAFKTAFENWKNPAERTITKTATLRDAKTDFTSLYRQLYKGMLRKNPLVTDADLVMMGMPERPDGRRRSASVIQSSPAAFVKLPGPGLIEILFRDDSVDNRRRGKPSWARGAEIYWSVSDKPPVDWSELANRTFCSASPVRLPFEGEKRGQRLYYALRWENFRGEKGPWNEIQYTVIP